MIGATALPASSQAAQVAPPGKAGATQYFETIPTSKGNVAPPTGGSSNTGSSTGGSNGQTLATTGPGASGTRRLEQRGTDGKAAAKFAQATSPAAGSPASSTGIATGSGTRDQQPASGGTAMGGLASLVTGADAGGIGLLLPVLLGLPLLGAVFLTARRTARR